MPAVTLRRIGILGGMGPEATVLLMQRLLAAIPARDDADHIPLIVDQNTQVPSRIARLIDGTGDDPAPVLVTMAKRLQAAGAEALAMPCNTAHHFAAQIRSSTPLPFLDMVEASVARARKLADGAEPIGILGSPALQRIGLFDQAFAGTELMPAYPRDSHALLQAIRSIKAVGPTDPARAALESASSELERRGARVQLIACTEFSLISSAVPQRTIAIDTLDVLVEAIVDFAQGTLS